jgi:hypothetical protein
MPLSLTELKALLNVDEPDYASLATMAAGAIGNVRKLAASPDIALATKAVSLAGMIGGAGGIGVVGDAAASKHAIVRVAAAHAASYLPDHPDSAKVVAKLLGDRDVGVVKIAARAVAGQGDPSLASKAKQATARLGAAAKAAATSTRQSTTKGATMATQRPAKAAGKTAKAAGKTAKAAGKKATAAGMPTGAMIDPPKGAKAGRMPTGAMG